jgi:DNA-binding transcriptional LysR family regulator
MDRIEELAIFVAIVDSGSLAGAAKRLKHSPPAVTRALAAIERRVGTRLIERTTRRLGPTQAGRRFAERARVLLHDYSDALNEISSERGAPLRGLLRVTASTVFGRRHLVPLVATFLDAHPGLRIELVLNERNLDLIDEGLDLALRIGQLADSRLIARRVGEIRRTLIASPAYLRNRPELRNPRDLAKHDVIFYSGFGSPTEWRFQARGRRQSIRLTPRIMTTDADAVLSMVGAGRGIGRVMSYQAANEIASGKLIRLLPAFEPPALPVQVVVPSARLMAPAVRAFMDHVTKSLRTLAAIHQQG